MEAGGKSHTNTSLIPCVSIPNQTETVVGIHPDAFVSFEERIPQQQQHFYGSDRSRIAAQSNQWHQEQYRTAQAVEAGEAVEDNQLMDDVVGDNPEPSHPIRGASRASSSAEWQRSPL